MSKPVPYITGEYVSLEKSQLEQSRELWWYRWGPLTLSTIPPCISLLLLWADWKQWFFTADSYLAYVIFVDRTSVQVVLTPITYALAFLWTWPVFAAFNLIMRHRLARRQAVSVNLLRLCVAISNQTADLHLPKRLIILTLTFYGLAQVPNTLWTGAITPDVVYRNSDFSVNIANMSTLAPPIDPETGFDVIDGCMGVVQANGTFIQCPGMYQSGRIMTIMEAANPVGDANWTQAKFDKSAFSYIDRSYGVGASAGLLDEISITGMQNYTYEEIGFLTNVTCRYNSSSDWNISDNVTKYDADDTTILNVFVAQGKRPNDNWHTSDDRNSYAMISNGIWPNRSVAFSAGGCCNFWNGTAPYQLSIAAGTVYGFLNNIQCDIDFEPTTFLVNVDVVNRTVTVSPLDTPTTIENKNQRQGQFEWALRSLQELTQSTVSAYTSPAGEALLNSIRGPLGTDINGGGPLEEALPLVEASVQAAMDAIFVSLASYVQTQNVTQAQGTQLIQYVQIGSWKFHLGVLILTGNAFLGLLWVSYRTGVFAASPQFDFTDISVMIAAAHNGYTMEGPGGHLNWNGDPSAPEVCNSEWKMNTKVGDGSAPSIVLMN